MPALGAPPPGGPVAKAKAKAKGKAVAPQPQHPMAAFPGGGAAPVMPFGLQLAAAAPGAAAGGGWINLVNNAPGLGSLQLKGGDFVEVALADQTGAAWAATAVFQVRHVDAQDQAGQFALVDCCGSSDLPTRRPCCPTSRGWTRPSGESQVTTRKCGCRQWCFTSAVRRWRRVKLVTVTLWSSTLSWPGSGLQLRSPSLGSRSTSVWQPRRRERSPRPRLQGFQRGSGSTPRDPHEMGAPCHLIRL